MFGLNIPDHFATRKLTLDFFDNHDGSKDGAYTDINTVSQVERVNGGVDITTAATDNTEAARYVTSETLKFAAGKPIFFEAAYAFTDASPDDAAMFIGIVDGAAAALIVNGGLALRSGNIDCAGFVKWKGSDNWVCLVQSGAAGTQQTVNLIASDKNNLSGVEKNPSATLEWLSIEILPVASGHEAVFKIGTEVVARIQNIDTTSASEMQPTAFLKAGGADAQILSLYCWQYATKR